MRGRELATRWCTDAALNLAVFRVTVGVVVLAVQDVHALSTQAARIPMAVRTAPWGWAWAMRAIPLSPSAADVLRVVVSVAALTGALGLFARASFAVLCGAGLVLWAHAMTLGSAVHFHHLLWFSALLAASPCGDALSLDRWLRRRDSPPPADSPAYGIPIRAAWLLAGAIYFFPGFWKLATSGAAWVFSDNLLLHMRAKWTQMEGFTPLFRVDRHPWLCRLGALATVAFELSFVFLVLPRRTRPWAVAVALLFHQATDWFMGLRYPSLWCCYTVFVDWRGLLGRLASRVPRPEGHGTVRSSPRAARAAEAVAASPAILAEAPATQGLERTVPWPSGRGASGAFAVSAALLAGAVGLGAAGESDAWPFACYPKFDRLAPAALPAMGVTLVYADGERAVPTRAMFPEGRTQRYWALTWSLLGAHRSERASARRFAAFWSSVAARPGVRAMLPGARAVRFYRETITTDPDRRGDPPIARALLAELNFRDGRR